VSQNYLKELKDSAKHPELLSRDYLLPDASVPFPGRVREQSSQASSSSSSFSSSSSKTPQIGKKRTRPSSSSGKKGKGGGGKAKEVDEQILTLTNERIAVPEILFHPSDVGVHQAGVAEAVVESITKAHDILHPLLYANIRLAGGCTHLPGFRCVVGPASCILV